MELQMNQKINELQNEIEKLKEEKGKMNGEIIGLKVENHELKEKIAKIEDYMKKKKLSIPERKMSAELLNELFASMPLKNVFDLLAKMPNGLLARNVQKMINGIKEEMKCNKLNSADSGSKLSISVDGLEARHSGPNAYNSVRAVLPIPALNLKAINKPLIAFYYEMEILKGHEIVIGFCDLQFSMEYKDLGRENNSIGLCSKRRIMIDDKFTFIKSNNANGDFVEGDIVGFGIIHNTNSKMQYFGTCNGELLVKGALPSKFANIKLFPTVNLYAAGELIRMNFGKEEFKFKKFELMLE